MSCRSINVVNSFLFLVGNFNCKCFYPPTHYLYFHQCVYICKVFLCIFCISNSPLALKQEIFKRWKHVLKLLIIAKLVFNKLIKFLIRSCSRLVYFQVASVSLINAIAKVIKENLSVCLYY